MRLPTVRHGQVIELVRTKPQRLEVSQTPHCVSHSQECSKTAPIGCCSPALCTHKATRHVD